MITIYYSFDNFLPNVRSVCGTESISFLGPKLWNIVSHAFRKEILDAFKKLINKWQSENCVFDYVNHTYIISVLPKIHGSCFYLFLPIL